MYIINMQNHNYYKFLLKSNDHLVLLTGASKVNADTPTEVQLSQVS